MSEAPFTKLMNSINSNQPVGEALLYQDKFLNSALHWAVYANNVEIADRIMHTAKTVEGLFAEVSLLRDDNGNTPLGVSFSDEKYKDVKKAILHQVLENGDVIVLVLTTANDYEISPLENIIILDDAAMFKDVMKKSSAQGVAKELLSFTNSEGKTVAQIAAVNNAHKIQAYIINSKVAPSVQAATKALLKALESSVTKSQFGVVKQAYLDANDNLQIAQAEEIAAKKVLKAAQGEVFADKAKYDGHGDGSVATNSGSPARITRSATTPKKTTTPVPKAKQVEADKKFWETADANLKAAESTHQTKANALESAKKTADQAAQNAFAFKAGQVVNKLPQLADDLNWAANKLGFDLAGKTGLQEVSYVKPALVTGAGLVASVAMKSPLVGVSSVFQNKWIQDAIEEYCGTGYVAPLNVLFTTGLVVAGVQAGMIALPVAGVVMTIQALNYGLGYVDEDSSLVLAKPAIEFATHAVNIAVSPLAVLQLFEAIHMVRSMADLYGENSEQYAKVYANLMQAKEKLSPADVEFLIKVAPLNDTAANTSGSGLYESEAAICDDNSLLVQHGFTYFDFQSAVVA